MIPARNGLPRAPGDAPSTSGAGDTDLLGRDLAAFAHGGSYLEVASQTTR